MFYNKTILCNCDDPMISNFYKYFVDNFEKLNIKKVIAISYKKYKKEILYIYDETNKKYHSIKDLIKLKGNGDFRNDENINILKEVDIVVTNPPFSLFREYIEQLFYYKKKFLIISNINAITYKNVFERIKNNKVKTRTKKWRWLFLKH